MVDKAVFEEHFWWCYERFNALATPEVGVPGYFRFITLLGTSACLHWRASRAKLGALGCEGSIFATWWGALLPACNQATWWQGQVTASPVC